MQKQKIVHPDRDQNFVTGAYSDGVLIDGFLFVSGQVSVDFKSSKFILGTIEEETARTLDNIKAIIESAGGTIDDIVKCSVHLADINDFDRYNVVYDSYFKSIKPARITVQSVLAENLKVEIDAIVKIS
jgi:2-iminobutanoate/2-iminopropanoate deaminase